MGAAGVAGAQRVLRARRCGRREDDDDVVAARRHTSTIVNTDSDNITSLTY